MSVTLYSQLLWYTIAKEDNIFVSIPLVPREYTACNALNVTLLRQGSLINLLTISSRVYVMSYSVVYDLHQTPPWNTAMTSNRVCINQGTSRDSHCTINYIVVK